MGIGIVSRASPTNAFVRERKHLSSKDKDQIDKINRLSRQICEQIGVANREQKAALVKSLQSLQTRLVTLVKKGHDPEAIDFLSKTGRIVRNQFNSGLEAQKSFREALSRRDAISFDTDAFQKANKELQAASQKQTGIEREIRECTTAAAQTLSRQGETVRAFHELNDLVEFTLDGTAALEQDGPGMDVETFEQIQKESAIISSSLVKSKKSRSLLQIIKGIIQAIRYELQFIRSDRKLLAESMNLSTQCLEDLKANKTPSLDLLIKLEKDLKMLAKNTDLSEGTRKLLESHGDQLRSAISNIRANEELKPYSKIFQECDELCALKRRLVSSAQVLRLSQTLDTALEAVKEEGAKSVIREQRLRILDALTTSQSEVGDRQDFLDRLEELGLDSSRSLYFLEKGHAPDIKMPSRKLEERMTEFLYLDRDVTDLSKKRDLLIEIKNKKFHLNPELLQGKIDVTDKRIQELSSLLAREQEIGSRIESRNEDINKKEEDIRALQKELDDAARDLAFRLNNNRPQIKKEKEESQQKLRLLSQEISRLPENSSVKMIKEQEEEEENQRLSEILEKEKENNKEIEALEQQMLQKAFEIRAIDLGLDKTLALNGESMKLLAMHNRSALREELQKTRAEHKKYVAVQKLLALKR